MGRRGVYFGGAGIVCHAGKNLAAVAEGLRNPQVSPEVFSIDEVTPPMSVPYLPAQFTTSGNRMVELAHTVASDALSAVPEASREDMPLFLASSTPDLFGIEPGYLAAMARGERPEMLHRPSVGLMASELSEKLKLGGGQYSINTACSSGANALLYAATAIERGDCERALVLGIEAPGRVALAGFSALMLVSQSGCRPFDESRDGLILGEAAAAVVLTAHPEDGALSGMRLLGGTTACDSANPTQTDAESVSRIIRAAMADAGVKTVDAIKAHGTGTPGNDRAEALGINACLGSEMLPVTSVKSALGHTLGACGVVETAAIAACWQAGFLPPTVGFQNGDPALQLAPINEAYRLGPGRVLLNYFGFGGNNSALILEYQP